MLVFALLAVFVAGLMVGRTPEFLGKKIRGPQMKLIVAYVLTIPVVTLVFGSISLVIPAGTSAILNPGFHGLSEVTYEFASVANNNGSAFAGLSANTPWYNTTARPRHAHRPVRSDRARAGDRRLTGRCSRTPAYKADARHYRADIRRVLGKRHRDRWGAHLLADAHLGPDRRAHRRVAVLAERKAKSTLSSGQCLDWMGQHVFCMGRRH